jgi:hypothetical protein
VVCGGGTVSCVAAVASGAGGPGVIEVGSAGIGEFGGLRWRNRDCDCDHDWILYASFVGGSVERFGI